MKCYRYCLKFAVLLAAFCFLPFTAHAVDLPWDPNTEPDLAGYRGHWGQAFQNYAHHQDVGKQTTVELTVGDGTWFFAVTAYDTSGNESGYSNEVTTTIAPPPDITSPAQPTNLQFSAAPLQPGTLSFDFQNGTIAPFNKDPVSAGGFALATEGANSFLRITCRNLPGPGDNGCAGHASIGIPAATEIRFTARERLTQWYYGSQGFKGYWFVSDAFIANGESVQHGYKILNDWWGSGERPGGTVAYGALGVPEYIFWYNTSEPGATQFNWKNQEGKWVDIDVYMKLNTPGKSDGVYVIKQNGVVTFQRHDLNIRGSSSEPMRQFWITAYLNCPASDCSHEPNTSGLKKWRDIDDIKIEILN